MFKPFCKVANSFINTLSDSRLGPIADEAVIPDYEVVHLRESQVGWVPQMGTLNGELEHVITLNGIEYVWIYRISR